MDFDYYSYLARTIPPREIARALTVRAKRALGMPAERVRKQPVHAIARPSLELSKIIEIDNDAVLHEANEAKKGTLPMFGQWKDCGSPIDYHRDPLMPSVIYDAKVPGEQVNLFVPGADAKVMWEVGRLSHLWRFAQARAITSDVSWSNEWKRELDHFRATNPAGLGVQWSCAMEVSLRAANIAASYSLVGNEVPAADVVAVLEEHCEYVSRHLEEAGAIRTNHYAADLVGLIVSGSLFPELSHWHAAFAKRLWDEIPRQVRKDGTHFEASIGYQRLCAEMFWLAAESSRAAGKPPPAAVDRAIAGLFESLGKVLKPNGDIPQIGDLDSCHALPATPRSALDGSYFRNVKASRGSECLDGAGIAVLRAGDAYLCMSSGPNGQGGTGGHAHNDKNSVELTFGRDNVILDRGTFVYARDSSERNAHRSVAGHSTVQVDGIEQNRIIPGRLFALPDRSHARIIEFGATYAVGEHSGYAAWGVDYHRRRISLTQEAAVLSDELLGRGEHAFASRYFIPHTRCVIRKANSAEEARIRGYDVDIDRCVSIMNDKGEEIALIAFNATARWTVELSESWLSPGYAERIRGTRAQLEMFSPVPARITAVVLRLRTSAA